MAKGATVKLLEADYHRNGISGEGFHVYIVREREGGKWRRMLVVHFRELDGQGNVACAAFDIDRLAVNDIALGSNSWRGDYYHDLLKRLDPEGKAWEGGR